MPVRQYVSAHNSKSNYYIILLMRENTGVQAASRQLGKSRCRDHPQYDLDTICFHPRCRQQHTQVICSYCGAPSQPHAQHSPYLTPIYSTSPAFRLARFPNASVLHAELAQQKHLLSQSLLALQETMAWAMAAARGQLQQRIECLGDFIEENGIFKICSRIRHCSDAHAPCCLSFLNALRDLEEQGQPSLAQAEETARQQIIAQAESLKGQIACIQECLQVSLEKVFGCTLPVEPAQKLLLTSELIPLEQVFHPLAIPRAQPLQSMIGLSNENIAQGQSAVERNIQIDQIIGGNAISENKINNIISCESVIDVENKEEAPEVKKLALSPAAKPKDLTAAKHRQIMKQTKHKDKLKVKLANQKPSNKCSPIVLDEETSAAEPHFSHSESIINELLLDQDLKNPLSVSQMGCSPTYRVQKPLQVQKWPSGIEVDEVTNTIILWKVDDEQHILSVLQAANRARHLIVEDKRMAQKETLLKLMRAMPNLEGLHLHCDSQITADVLDHLQTLYFSYLPNYRFLRLIDLSKYFPKRQLSILHQVPACLQQLGLPVRNVFVRDADGSVIKEWVEEVSFVQDESEVFWVFGVGLEESLLTAERLLVLVFSNILIRKRVSFKAVYERHSSLHTLVFDDCEGDHEELISQLQYLRPNQLVHFQLSAENRDRKIQLSQNSADEIFRHTQLETLILKVEFRYVGRLRKSEQSRILRKIENLRELSHLNLYSSEPVFSDLLSYINRRCYHKMKVLNLGCSEIDKSAANIIQKFTRLEALGLDYTELGEEQILQITRKMPSLEKLSLESLSGGPVIYKEESLNSTSNKYGLVTPKLFERLRYQTLRYLNIYECRALSSYGWEKYSKLECLRVNSGLLNKEVAARLQLRGVHIFVATQSTCNGSPNHHQALLEATKSSVEGKASGEIMDEGGSSRQEDNRKARSQITPSVSKSELKNTSKSTLADQISK